MEMAPPIEELSLLLFRLQSDEGIVVTAFVDEVEENGDEKKENGDDYCNPVSRLERTG